MSDGSLVIALKIFGCALFWRSSALIIVVGVGALKPVALMREPVTTTTDSSSFESASWAYADG